MAGFPQPPAARRRGTVTGPGTREKKMMKLSGDAETGGVLCARRGALSRGRGHGGCAGKDRPPPPRQTIPPGGKFAFGRQSVGRYMKRGERDARRHARPRAGAPGCDRSAPRGSRAAARRRTAARPRRSRPPAPPSAAPLAPCSSRPPCHSVPASGGLSEPDSEGVVGPGHAPSRRRGGPGGGARLNTVNLPLLLS
jgi:hypothetical protein